MSFYNPFPIKPNPTVVAPSAEPVVVQKPAIVAKTKPKSKVKTTTPKPLVADKSHSKLISKITHWALLINQRW